MENKMDNVFTIDKRTFERISSFCSKNGIDPGKYIADAITERINVDMYGDLNGLIARSDVAPVKDKPANAEVNSDLGSAGIEEQGENKEKTSKNGTSGEIDKETEIKKEENESGNEKQKKTRRRTIEVKK